MPPPDPLSTAGSAEVPLPSAPPSYLPTLVQAPAMPARHARYGQLMGFCMTICTRGAEYKHMFYETLRHLEALAV
jgi:hypothetical protein